MDPADRLKANLDGELASWLDGFGPDLAGAWRGCPRASWLLSMALAVDVDRKLVVHAAADLAGASLPAELSRDSRPQHALRTALAWLEGRASSSEAWASGFAAMEAADREVRDTKLAAAMRAAACVAFACDDRADATFYAHRAYASKAAEHAAELLADPAAADQVRARIPISAFLSAFATASQPPPPMPEQDDAEPGSDSFYA
jgi:hypothetical protein